jgi:hypothetical protein
MEGASVKSTMSDLNKKMSLLKTDVKGGNINDIITRLMSIEIFMGKAIKDLNKLVKESVEYETDLDSLFEEELREAKWKLTSMSAKDAIKKYGKDKVRVGHLKMRDKSTSVEINEAVSMKNAKGIGFGKKGGYDKYVTLAKKKNAKSYKDVLKVLSREGLGKEELDNVADYVMNALGESVELEEVFNQAQMKKAIGIARKSRGNYDKAYAEIEKIKKGLGDEDIIAHVLKKANESVEIEEGFRVVGVTTSGEKFKSGILKTQKDADNKHWKLTKATDLRGKKVYKTLKVVKESIELEEGANLQIFKDSGYTMQRNGKGSTFTIFYGKKAVAHGQSKGGKVNPATVNKNTTLTWTIPSKNNMTTPLSGVDAVKYLKKNLIESVELDEAYDRGSIRDFKVGDKVKFVDDKSSHHGQTGKITKLIGGIGARQKAHVKLDKTKKTVIDILTSTDLIKESVEINEAVLDEGVSSEAKSVMREINKHLKILKTELKTSDENQDWKARLNRIEGIIGKVKWTVEESVDLEEGVSLLKKGKYELTADGKSSVGVTLSLRHKGKQIITGTKKDGMFIMAFEKHNVRNKLPKGAEIVKKGKWMHIGFKKADDVIAYAKGQGFVADNKGVAESLVMQLVAKLKEK